MPAIRSRINFEDEIAHLRALFRHLALTGAVYTEAQDIAYVLQSLCMAAAALTRLVQAEYVLAKQYGNLLLNDRLPAVQAAIEQQRARLAPPVSPPAAPAEAAQPASRPLTPPSASPESSPQPSASAASPSPLPLDLPASPAAPLQPALLVARQPAAQTSRFISWYTARCKLRPLAGRKPRDHLE